MKILTFQVSMDFDRFRNAIYYAKYGSAIEKTFKLFEFYGLEKYEHLTTKDVTK